MNGRENTDPMESKTRFKFTVIVMVYLLSYSELYAHPRNDNMSDRACQPNYENGINNKNEYTICFLISNDNIQVLQDYPGESAHLTLSTACNTAYNKRENNKST